MAVMYLWRPSETSKRFAYQQLPEGDEEEGDDLTDEVMREDDIGALSSVDDREIPGWPHRKDNSDNAVAPPQLKPSLKAEQRGALRSDDSRLEATTSFVGNSATTAPKRPLGRYHCSLPSAARCA